MKKPLEKESVKKELNILLKNNDLLAEESEPDNISVVPKKTMRSQKSKIIKTRANKALKKITKHKKNQVKMTNKKERAELRSNEGHSSFVDLVKQSQKFFHRNIKKYKVSLMGIRMGSLVLSSKPGRNVNEWVFSGRLKNMSLYKYLYSVDDYVETRVFKKNLLPFQVSMEKNENGATSLSIQKHKEDRILFFEKAIKKGKRSKKERTVKFKGHYFDPLSFIQMVEVVPLPIYEKKKVPVVFRGKLYFLKVRKVEGSKQSKTIHFDTFHNGKIKKDQKIVIDKRYGKNPRIIKLRGKMKVGELVGVLIE